MRPSKPLNQAAKRAMDLTIATLSLGVALPVGLGAALAIRYSMGSPVLYGQMRLGYQHKPFRVWKFRTMTNERGPDGELLPDAVRLTKVGRWLREASLDELPQLVNVFSGEMSIVGPRPLLTRYLHRYSERQKKRHDVRPGITGWAQVNGRNALDWESRLELDAWYAENQSLGLDVKILLKTVMLVIRRDSVLSGAGADLDEFWGSAGPPATGPRAFPVEQDEEVPNAGIPKRT